MSGFLGMLFPGPSSGGGGGPSEYIATSGSTYTKAISVYPWNSTTGFGTAYPAQLSPALPQVSFVPDNSNISISTSNGSPWFKVWPWSSLGYGTQYVPSGSFLNPSTGNIAGYTWTPNIDAVLSANVTAPNYPQAYSFNSASGLGTKYSNGTVISSSGSCKGITLNGDGSLAAVAMVAASPNPTIAIYPWNSTTGFGTRFANPSTLPDSYTQYSLTISFNKVTNDVIVGKFLSNFVAAYPVTSSGFGTKYSDPTTSFGAQPTGLRFSPDGSTIAAATTAFTPVTAFSWGGGFGTKYADPISPISYANSMDWESTTKAIAFGNSTSAPFLSVYAWSSGGFGSLYSSPSVAPGTALSVSFSNQSR